MKKNLPRKGKGIAFNVSMLYIMNIAKLVFPLITLPYLTRVLSVDCYGVVSYVKATMVYAQLVVDFGFMLSGVKAITEAREDRELVGRIKMCIRDRFNILVMCVFCVVEHQFTAATPGHVLKIHIPDR